MFRFMSVLLLGIAAAGCAGAPAGETGRETDPARALNRTWQWAATVTPVEKIAVPAPERYTIFLQEDGRVQVRFDCNRGGGEYRIEEGTLSFGPLMATRMACPQGSLDARFTKDLQRVSSFFFQDGELYLELPYDSGTMRFREAP